MNIKERNDILAEFGYIEEEWDFISNAINDFFEPVEANKVKTDAQELRSFLKWYNEYQEFEWEKEKEEEWYFYPDD